MLKLLIASVQAAVIDSISGGRVKVKWKFVSFSRSSLLQVKTHNFVLQVHIAVVSTHIISRFKFIFI